MSDFVRKNNRLSEDLYQGGYWYSVTLCVQNKAHIFGQVIEDTVILNDQGRIVEHRIHLLPEFYKISIEQYVIMPNHIHMIVGNINQRLSDIIKGFKSFSYREIKRYVDSKNGDQEVSATKKLVETYNTIWQKSFYDHIIRNDQDLERIQEYMYHNPIQWYNEFNEKE